MCPFFLVRLIDRDDFDQTFIALCARDLNMNGSGHLRESQHQATRRIYIVRAGFYDLRILLPVSPIAGSGKYAFYAS